MRRSDEEKRSDDRLNNVNLLRFLFCMYVVFFHILHANIMPYVQDIPYYSHLAGLVTVKDAFVATWT